MPVISDNKTIPLIDIGKVIASKDPKLLTRIPKFLIRYLKRIVHQDEINEFLIKNEGVTGIDFVNNCIDFMNFTVEIRGAEDIPKDARLIFASNHPLGGADGMCLVKAIHENIRQNPKSLSNDLLLNVKPLRNFMIGVNKHGGNSKNDVEEMRTVFEGSDPVIFFASGLVSRRRWCKIEDVSWKGTFIKKSQVYHRDVVPVFISGRVSGFFYRLANLRKLLRIRNNIEMIYLPNEMFKQRGLHLIIKFGKPIPWQSFDSDKKPEEWAADVKKQVYRMGKTL